MKGQFIWTVWALECFLVNDDMKMSCFEAKTHNWLLPLIKRHHSKILKVFGIIFRWFFHITIITSFSPFYDCCFFIPVIWIKTLLTAQVNENETDLVSFSKIKFTLTWMVKTVQKKYSKQKRVKSGFINSGHKRRTRKLRVHCSQKGMKAKW